MCSPGACEWDPAATVAFPRAAGDVARRGACGATWRGLKAPAEAVLIAEKPHDSSHLGSIWLKSEEGWSGSILNFKSEMIL